jgi:hypothetical protein
VPSLKQSAHRIGRALPASWRQTSAVTALRPGEPGVRSAEDLVAFLKQEFVTFPDAHEALL